jgi:histidinol-phosphate phosphatase family protein
MTTVFLDRDGVINRNLKNDYVKSWEEFEFLPNALEAIQHLTEAGYQLIVVTNQACINKGIISSKTLEEIHQRMVTEIEAVGGRIHAIYHCPHRDDERCDCRKPKPGMLIQAAYEHGIDLSWAYLIGDSMRDIAAGQQVGCRTLLVLTGPAPRGFRKVEHTSQQIKNSTLCGSVQPDEVFADLYTASLWIEKN